MKVRSTRSSCSALILVAGVGGCALPGPSGGAAPSAAPPPPTRSGSRGVEAPSGTQPVQIFISRGTPTDSDGDAYADTIPVVAYLFPDPAVSHMPVWADGEFEFRLLDADQHLFARWIYPPEVAATARQRLAPGPAYSFFLRLGGDDERISRQSMELSAIFRTPSGKAVTSNGSAAVQLGLD